MEYVDTFLKRKYEMSENVLDINGVKYNIYINEKTQMPYVLVYPADLKDDKKIVVESLNLGRRGKRYR
jgi:hypothetical protein